MVSCSIFQSDPQWILLLGSMRNRFFPYMESLTLVLANRKDELRRLTSAVETYCAEVGLSKKTIYHVALALDELVTNAISYGFTDEADHSIKVELHRQGDDFFITVEDDAKPFNPLEKPPPVLKDPPDIGGLGIHLVRKLMDDIEYRREGERNVISMRKKITTNE